MRVFDRVLPPRYPSVIRTGFIVCALCLASATAVADDTRDRLDRLERDIQLLSQSVYRGETAGASAPQPLVADAGVGPSSGAAGSFDYDRLSTVEELVRDLTGRVERIEFDNRTLADRLSALEQHAAGGAPSAARPGADTPASAEPQPQAPSLNTPPTIPADPQSVNSPSPASLPVDDPATLYEEAYKTIQQGQYEAAGTAFKTFLDRYGDHALAPNARYWLAETHFARKDFGPSTRLFAENYQADPKGPKAADNLLKLALSLAAQGKTKESCIAFDQIGRDFPAAPPAISARVSEERTKLACP